MNQPIKLLLALMAVAFYLMTTAPAWAILIETVPVGDPGNPANPNTLQAGAVGYSYDIGKYDVTASQYTAFLNAVAKSDPFGLYNVNMQADSAGCGIGRFGSSGSYIYAITKNGNYPVNWVSWGDAARFCNWLYNGQLTPAASDTTAIYNATETGSYTLGGVNSNQSLITITRNANATWVLPTFNEAYKAAYYKGGGTNAGYWKYPTRSDDPPVSVLSATGTNNANCYNNGYFDPTNFLTEVGAFASTTSAYGTYDQAGDVWQWNETVSGSSNRKMSGSSFDAMASIASSSSNGGSLPMTEDNSFGFRVASVPEPSSLILFVLAAIGIGLIRKWIGPNRADSKITSCHQLP